MFREIATKHNKKTLWIRNNDYSIIRHAGVNIKRGADTLAYLAYLTPNGQVTIPRPIMKILGIGAGNNVQISLGKDCLILKSVKEPIEKDNFHVRD